MGRRRRAYRRKGIRRGILSDLITTTVRASKAERRSAAREVRHRLAPLRGIVRRFGIKP